VIRPSLVYFFDASGWVVGLSAVLITYVWRNRRRLDARSRKDLALLQIAGYGTISATYGYIMPSLLNYNSGIEWIRIRINLYHLVPFLVTLYVLQKIWKLAKFKKLLKRS